MNKVIIYTDGGARGNPGPAAAGVVFYLPAGRQGLPIESGGKKSNEKQEIFKEYSQYLGENLTNNEAEYRAVIFALKRAKLLFGKKATKNLEVEIKSDSELLVRQMEGKYKILEPKIQKLFIKVWNLKIDFKKVKFTAIARERNKEADRLVNQAL
ncbi:MAG: hypothetical protein CO144_01320 [Candidatus Nealsonbacteria bacterium CG_4_9_14_3_um_filter_35_11]|uniref:RNase H type-1 domain-containing protein n=2 Tax=Candidatus Nealsoniibacteriota TaxID=1817911 RepID=A0A2M7DAS0_9BACT|nr:MAG: hypothetical protein COV62_01495 [Candidatus Nealsonbacteria bacterium CG11_big_fil_rev_8_21_14_0_20_35_11]PIV45543.1 MAG: hypothetical protein COS24_01765 [Candidatus Nealsonbacteria bacterium CG02_land_8_20_14_3_00_34_20]PIW92725.1 MAG: hypothetical protein COZ88_00690 [Candidatus Nealsonbacteria bacterium CG_4_8_14_3_um_filter_34_13]PIZ89860.1 MAG: hypothetical protein COX88_01555 [Candidatus Nealsonbacteria bacterium CG_4_10_14_0_2_um_filter_35_20]PJA84553.1 MAG: hypothetical protei